ncbi:MAG: ABC transporter ATP-binding protein [Candidatus Hodarchaeales archaeon]|jgi:ABC-type sugar transport system ATPase subunit
MAFFEVKDLYYRYNDQWILETISFGGKKGELIAIVGPSGCGKTTLLKLIVGVLKPQKGQVFLDYVDILGKPIEMRNIGYVPQTPSLFPHQTVFENIAFGLKAQKWGKLEVKSRVNELAKTGGIIQMLKRQPHELSGGQQQRVALMRALAPSPQLLLLDEPLSNIDTHLREHLAIYIRDIQKLYQITTLFVTHDLNEAKMLADKLIVLNVGKIVQIGSPINVVLRPNSVDVARTLGMKNIFTILSVVQDDLNENTIVTTEFGKISIPTSVGKELWANARGLYIDPTTIEILNEPTNDINVFSGEILANIAEPMIHQSTLVVKIRNQNSGIQINPDIPIKDHSKILRIQIPITESNYQNNDIISVKINPHSIQLYE